MPTPWMPCSLKEPSVNCALLVFPQVFLKHWRSLTKLSAALLSGTPPTDAALGSAAERAVKKARAAAKGVEAAGAPVVTPELINEANNIRHVKLPRSLVKEAESNETACISRAVFVFLFLKYPNQKP